MTDLKKIEWVIRFAETGLRSLHRAGDWMNLKEEVCEFLGVPTSQPIECTLDTLLPVQEAVQRMLRTIARANADKSGEPQGLYFNNAQDCIVAFDLLNGDLRPSLISHSPTLTEYMLFTLLVVLTKLEASRVRECLFCHRIFFAEHGRQEYDSPLCSNRVRRQRFKNASVLAPTVKNVSLKTQEAARKPKRMYRLDEEDISDDAGENEPPKTQEATLEEKKNEPVKIKIRR